MTTDCPLVSGVSPNEGLPGTKITIRGENLGSRKDDIISIVICGSNCIDSLEYHSSRKLVCNSPNVRGKGEIIVTTFTGGQGKCTVGFTSLEAAQAHVLDPLAESDVWVEEDFNMLARVFSDKNESPVYTRDLTDPLGQSYRKVRAGSENLGDLFPNSSGSLTDENFNPVRHLLEKHRYTSFEELKMGAKRLKREVEMNDQAPTQFMRDNLDAFLQCYDTLSDINSALLHDESKTEGGSLTGRAEDLLRESASQAQHVFEGILKSKARADTSRNALTVLQRYRFLFSLPKNIEKNIKNHEYDLVATDYEKAKSLFSNTQVSIFKRVLEEVEKQIAKFRENLKQQLLILPSTLEQQKRLIKYLLELDCEGDPAWDCISNMALWILRLLYTSKEDCQAPQDIERVSQELAPLPDVLTPVYEALPPSLPPRLRGQGREEGHSRTISDTSTSSYGSQATVSSEALPVPGPEGHRVTGAGGMPILKLAQGTRKGDAGRPNRIMFVEEMTEIFSATLPDLWKLGQAYLNGSLFQGVALLSENQQKLAKRCDSSKGKFETKVTDIIDIYTNMVTCALFPDFYESLTESTAQKLGEWHGFGDSSLEISGVWLPQSVRRIRESVMSLEGLQLPEKGMTMLHNLAMNVRSLCMDTLFQRASRDIKILHEREDWNERNEECGTVTSLPILFENRVIDVLLTLREIVIEPREDSIPEINSELRDTAKTHFTVLLEHFLASIDWLAFHADEESQESVDRGSDEQPSLETTCEDKHLLILMSNMNYLMSEVIPNIFSCFVKQGYQTSAELDFSLQDDMIAEVTVLDDKIFEAYIRKKSECLRGIIENGMQVGYFDWNHAKEPTQVRSYIREILMNLVLIHSEVFAVSASIVPRVMHELVRILSREFMECINEVEAFNVNGVIHGFVELAALEDILEPYLDSESRENFENSKKHLGSWDIRGNERITELVEEFKTNTRLQLKCFKVLSEPDSETDSATVEDK